MDGKIKKGDLVRWIDSYLTYAAGETGGVTPCDPFYKYGIVIEVDCDVLPASVIIWHHESPHYHIGDIEEDNIEVVSSATHF